MAEGSELELPRKVTAEQDILLNTKLGPGAYSVDWAVRCISGKAKRFTGMRANLFGTLVASAEHPEKLVFLSRRRFRTLPVELDVVGCEVTHESKFLSENVVIYDRNENRTIVFRFTRGQSALAGWLADDLLKRREQAEDNDALAGRLNDSLVEFPAEQAKTAATGS